MLTKGLLEKVLWGKIALKHEAPTRCKKGGHKGKRKTRKEGKEAYMGESERGGKRK